MIGLRETCVVVLSAVTVTACDQSSVAAERFASSGKRLASLPDSCLNARVDRYEKVDTDAFSDGEVFGLTLDAKCSEEWRKSLSGRSDLVCDEDVRPLDRPVERPFYSCLDHSVPEDSQTWISFRDSAHAEFHWVKVR